MKANVYKKDSALAAIPLEGTVFSVLIIISMSHLLNDMLQSVVPSIYPILKDKFAFSFAQIGVITLVYQLTASILQPLTGLYADKHPRPYALALAMLFCFSGIVCLAFATGYSVILLSVMLIGFGSSLFHPNASRVVQLASGGRKSLAQSIFQVGGSSGSAVGPLLAALIVLPFGQAAISAFAVAAVIAAVLLIRAGRWYRQYLEYVMTHKKARSCIPCNLSSRMKLICIVLLVILVFSKHFYTACVTNYFTFFLIEKFRVSIAFSQICLFSFLASVAAGTLIGGALGDRIGRKYVILLSIFGAAPFALMVPYMELWGTVVACCLSGFIISSAFASIVVYATDLLPDRVGMIAGFFYGLMFGLGGIGSAFFGYLADRTSIIYIFEVSSLLPLLGIIAIILPNLQKKAA